LILINFMKSGLSNSTIMWIVVVLVVWYMFGKELNFIENKILTPEEAIMAAKKSKKFLYRTNQLDISSKIYLGPNISLFHTEGQPKYYLINAEIRTGNSIKKKRCQVYATGDSKGYVCWQDVTSSFTGREAIPVARPKWMNELPNYGVSLKDVMTGVFRK
jgi:hypothetical protein